MSEFSDLQCGLTNDHIVREPIRLACGHCICKKCVSDRVNIQCRICNKETYKSKLEMNKEPVPIKNSIKRSLTGLFDDLEKRATEGINSFKSKINLLIEWF